MTDVLIIGAGPAGLAAARAARRRGAFVTLLDSADAMGGQYWRHLPSARPSEREAVLHHGWATFSALRESLEADDGCDILTSAHVWSIERKTIDPKATTLREGAPVTVHVLVGEPDGVDREQRVFEPDALVIATGAFDRTLPFPGWDLPGVFTAGAAQALAKGERVAIGERVVVAGAGPFLLPVAASLVAAGSTVIGVYEASRVGTLANGWLPKPWQLFRAAKKGGELAGYVLGHLRHRIPYRPGKAVIRANGTNRVESVTIASVDANWKPIAGTEETVAVDAVCVGHGFTPRLELAIAAGCYVTDFVECDDQQRSDVPFVYAAGEVTGIGGADLALAEGEIAGHCAAGGSLDDREIAPAITARDTHTSFAERIERAHGIGDGWSGWLSDDTVVCRCEEVGFGALCSAIEATHGASLRSIKMVTRVGLGICQGRVCGRAVEEILHARATGSREHDTRVDHRQIAMPIRLSELAAVPSTDPTAKLDH
jgi:NADPH-dependent 2,4-dienoyl-CoA reductase/sulfur reductase-like enzyme